MSRADLSARAESGSVFPLLRQRHQLTLDAGEQIGNVVSLQETLLQLVQDATPLGISSRRVDERVPLRRLEGSTSFLAIVQAPPRLVAWPISMASFPTTKANN